MQNRNRFLPNTRLWQGVAAALGVALCAGVLAQPPDDTVQWTAALDAAAAVPAGGAVGITVSAAIKDGWHVYALEQLPGGPTPLKVTLADNTLAAADGKPEAGQPVKVFDARFGLATQLYSHAATVRLPVKLAAGAPAGSQQLTVNVRFQSCSDQECRPPRTVHLAVPVEVSAHE